MSDTSKPLTAEEWIKSELYTDEIFEYLQGVFYGEPGVRFNGSAVKNNMIRMLDEYAAQQVAAKDVRIKELEERLSFSNSKRQELGEKIDEYRGKLARTQVEEEAAKRELEAVKSRHRETVDLLNPIIDWGHSDKNIQVGASICEEVVKRAKECESLREELEALETAANHDIHELTEERDNYRDELEAVKKERDEANFELEQLRPNLAEAVKQIKSWKAECEKAEAETKNFLLSRSFGETKRVSPWINVEDGLPDLNTPVYVWLQYATKPIPATYANGYRGGPYFWQEAKKLTGVKMWTPRGVPAAPESLTDK